VFKAVQLHHHDSGLVKQWNKLNAWIQRRIEHFLGTNGSGGALLRGHVVAMVGDRSVQLTDDSDPEALYAGVSAMAADNGDNVIVRTDNLAYVLFEDQLNPVAGQPCYVSATPGLATDTNVGPVVTMQLGIIFDATPYATEQACWVLLNKCCDPIERG